MALNGLFGVQKIFIDQGLFMLIRLLPLHYSYSAYITTLIVNTLTINILKLKFSTMVTLQEQFNESQFMEVYVKYLDCKNGFKETTKDFETYEKAWHWILKTFDKPSKDFIYYY